MKDSILEFISYSSEVISINNINNEAFENIDDE